MSNFNLTTLLSNTQEKWEFHPTYQLYLISSYGRVVSFRKGWEGTLLKLQNIKGYLYASVRPIYKIMKLKAVHTLVLETFVGLRPEGTECCHYDGNKQNNRLDNLRWGTPTENGADTKRINRERKSDLPPKVRKVYRGEAHKSAKLTELDVREIRELARVEWSDFKLAVKYKVGPNAINRITIGRGWKHVK